jgi:hypothetical protein
MLACEPKLKHRSQDQGASRPNVAVLLRSEIATLRTNLLSPRQPEVESEQISL